jgi:formylglycine-generating enzyme required for sulfatase activity
MSDPRPRIRIFISSPSDVWPERLKAEQIVRRLHREFRHHADVEAVLWEREPLVASRHFQDAENIPPPRIMDIVVVILWTRLGMLLPQDRFRGAVSGRCPVTGTEWEFEDALAGARENQGTPHLLIYRKVAEAVGSFDSRAVAEERLQQLDMVRDFYARWLYSPDGGSLAVPTHSFTQTVDFEEQLYHHLHALLERRIGAADALLAVRWHDAPFRALLSYEFDHAQIFFGRSRAVDELRELLASQISRGTAFVLVFGASGSGKSSLVKAGLLPDLMLPGMIGRVGLVRRAILRPSDMGGDPVLALAVAILSPAALPELGSLQYSAEQLAALLNEAPTQAALPIRQGLAAAGITLRLPENSDARLVVVVDQLEEIFTIDHLSQDGRATFVAALEALAKSGVVWIVTTMRSDFFDRLETLEALAQLSSSGRFLLLPPNEVEIGQIIRQPAQEAGLRFEHDSTSGWSLDEKIRHSATNDQDALPLLSFLLDQLWQKRSDTGFLTFAAYQELGGLEGAVGQRAEEVFQTQSEGVRQQLVPLLRALVTVHDGKATSRAAPLALFAEGSPQRKLVDAFRDAETRLLVSDSHAGQIQLRLAHEALLTHWPRAREQVATDARDLELRNRLEYAAQQWREASPRDRGKRVAVGLMLAEARALLARWGTELPDEVRRFIVSSRHAANWRLARLVAILFGAAAAVPVAACLIWMGLAWWGVRSVEAELAFVSIPAGCYDMGSPDNERQRSTNEGSVHQVCIRPLELARNEMTQEHWRRVMVFINPDPSHFDGPHLPVESVTWHDVQRFLRVMSFFGRYRYRLPSESEWEYAARAGTRTSRYWGESPADACAFENVPDINLKSRMTDAIFIDCDDGYSGTAPVGTYRSNPWGLHDMLGNVAEWVEDCYEKSSEFCERRVVRGGSWNRLPRNTRAAYRGSSLPGARTYGTGFRPVRFLGP